MLVVKEVNEKNGNLLFFFFLIEIESFLILFLRIHCFDNVAAVLFVAALSGYDCCLVEDKYSVSSNSPNVVQIFFNIYPFFN